MTRQMHSIRASPIADRSPKSLRIQRIFGVAQLLHRYESCNKAAGLITVAHYVWAQKAAARGRASRREEIVNRRRTPRAVGWARLIAGVALIGLLCNANAWAEDPA